MVPSVFRFNLAGGMAIRAHQALSRGDSLTAATGTTRPDADTLDAPTCAGGTGSGFMRSVMRLSKQTLHAAWRM